MESIFRSVRFSSFARYLFWITQDIHFRQHNKQRAGGFQILGCVRPPNIFGLAFGLDFVGFFDLSSWMRYLEPFNFNLQWRRVLIRWILGCAEVHLKNGKQMSLDPWFCLSSFINENLYLYTDEGNGQSKKIVAIRCIAVLSPLAREETTNKVNRIHKA